MRDLQIPLESYFPDCVLPNCELFKSGKVHQHILPHQQTILDSTADYLYCQGGVGSAKTVAFAVKAVMLSMQIPENVGVVSRKDYKLMYKSCWLDVKKTIRRIVQKGLLHPDMKYDEQVHYHEKKMYSDKRQGDYTTITFPNGSIIYAMQGKAWEEGLGASYGWFWVDDAMESYEEMFVGNDTSAGLLSRLRLPHVHYFRHEDGTTTNRLHGMVSSNPPPVGHWLHQLFGNKPGQYKIGEQTVDWLMVATHENPFVGADYAKGLMAVQSKMGRSQNVARRVIYGESVPAYGGVKVFPQFEHSRHVTTYKYNKDIPIVVGLDFGFLHPGVVFSHLYKCDYGTNHYISIGEIADAFSINFYELYDKRIKPYIRDRFSDCCLLLYGGDRAGWRKSSSSRDNRGDMRILVEEYHIPCKHRVLDLANSLQYMRGLLDPRRDCKCGMEIIQVDQLNCPVLIGALEGGYKYSKARDGKVSEKPVEDRYFADIACGWRYGAENYVKWGIPYEYQGQTKPEPVRPVSPFGATPWQWMEMSDEAMGQVLTR